MKKDPMVVVNAYYNNPNISNSELKRISGYSKRHIRRILSGIRTENHKNGKTGKPKSYNQRPKILLIDIETAPMVCYTWRIGYNINLDPENIVEDWFMICWCAKWLLKDGIFGDCVTSEESLNIDDKRICSSLWNTLEEADIIIAHNALKFDQRKVQARFINNELFPTSPYQVIDTLAQSRKIAAFSSHRLEYLTRTFGLSEKKPTDYKLWKKCKKGDKKALEYMFEYCKGDIQALEDLYLFLRPWMKSHPNIGVYCDVDGEICPSCGYNGLDWNINSYYTPAGRYRSFRCTRCGSIGRSRFTDIDKDLRKRLTLSTAR